MNKNGIILGVVIALLVAGSVFAYQQLFAGPQSVHEHMCMYDDCGWKGRVTMVKGPYPPKCPDCGRQSVLTPSTCKQCGHQQLLNEEIRNFSGFEGTPSYTKCHECGGRIVHGD